MKKSIKFIIIGLIAIAVASSSSWAPAVRHIVGIYVYEYEVNKLYESYMEAHPEPCDNLFMAHEASVKAFRENYYRFKDNPYDFARLRHNNMRRAHYRKVNNLTEENRPWFINNFYNDDGYRRYSECGFMFIDEYNDSDGDDMRGGSYEIHMKYDDKKWHVEFYEARSHEQVKSKVKQWNEAP